MSSNLKLIDIDITSGVESLKISEPSPNRQDLREKNGEEIILEGDIDTMESDKCLIGTLPPEIIYRIFSFLDDATSLCRAERTCHFWRTIINSQSLWRNLAIKLAGSRILPEKFNELGKGSLITGRYVPDEAADGKAGGVGDGAEGGRWNYLYRDLVRNMHCFGRIPNLDYREHLWAIGVDSPEFARIEKGPEIVNITSSMPELSKIPTDYKGSKDAYVTRKIDFALSAIEGMRLQSKPYVIAKTPPFTDSLCPGETEMDDTAWVYFADRVSFWPRVSEETIFKPAAPESSEATVQRGIFRAGTNGVFGDGYWNWSKDRGKDEVPVPSTIVTTEEGQDQSLDVDIGEGRPEASSFSKTMDSLLAEGSDSSDRKRPWKVFTTKAKSAGSSNLSLPLNTAENTTTKSEGPPVLPSLEPGEEFMPSPTPSPPPEQPLGPIKWAAAIDSVNSLPNGQRWDPERTILDSYKNIFSLTPADEEVYRTQDAGPHLMSVLHRQMNNQAHSDPNLRIMYERGKPGTTTDIRAIRVDRLALPSSKSIIRDSKYPKEPVAIVNSSWNLHGGAKWSLNSVPMSTLGNALEENEKRTGTSEFPEDEPFWTQETRFWLDDTDPHDLWEEQNKWEYRSCGDYLIVSDDVAACGPGTISCFKTGYHKEKADIDASTYLRGAALRNYLAAGPKSDLIWQKSVRREGFALDSASSAPVRSLDADGKLPGYFYDNDGLALNSKVVVYATRKKLYYTRNMQGLAEYGTHVTCMEFLVIAIETGHTINVLHLDHETRVLARGLPWYGWTSFAMSDTHLIATVGGNVHRSQGAENESDITVRTWSRDNRYGREEIFIWPLDVPDQNLSLSVDDRQISPTGILGMGFNQHRWWRRSRYVGISREGRFVCASSKYDMIVWDLWDAKTPSVHYVFNHKEGGLGFAPDGYPASKSENICWNGIWLQYRDIIIDPKHKSFSNSNPDPASETELLRNVIFIPCNEIRSLINGVDYDWQRTLKGQAAFKELDKHARRRYHLFEASETSESDSESLFDDYDDDDDDSDWHSDQDAIGMMWEGYDESDMYGMDEEDWDDPEYMGDEMLVLEGEMDTSDEEDESSSSSSEAEADNVTSAALPNDGEDEQVEELLHRQTRNREISAELREIQRHVRNWEGVDANEGEASSTAATASGSSARTAGSTVAGGGLHDEVSEDENMDGQDEDKSLSTN